MKDSREICLMSRKLEKEKEEMAISTRELAHREPADGAAAERKKAEGRTASRTPVEVAQEGFPDSDSYLFPVHSTFPQWTLSKRALSERALSERTLSRRTLSKQISPR